MHPGRLLRRRARAQAGLLALVGLLAALVAATLAGTFGYVGIAAREGLTAALRDADPQAAALQVRTRLDDADPAGQRAAAEEVLAATLGDLPVAVHPTARSLSLAATDTEGSPLGAVVAGSDDALAERATVVEGTWPADADPGPGAVPAALAADAAAVLGLAVGDEVVLTGDSRSVPLTVRVAALWQPDDPADPAWFGDPVVLDGTDGQVAGPFLLRDADLTSVPALVLVRWTLVPDPDALTPAELPALRDALDGVVDVLHEDGAVNRQGVAAEGVLDATLGSVDRALTAVRGVSTSAALLAVLVGLVVLGQLARLLVEVRGPETALLRSRGVTVGRAAAWAAVEAAVVLGVGAAVGALGAVLALRPLGTVPPATAVVAAAGVLVAGGALLTGAAAARSGRALRSGRADATRLGAGAAAGGLVLVAAVAALAVWRLVDLGSPVVVDAAGRSSVDPLAAAAVPVALVVVALLAAVALVPVARARAARAARRPDLGPVLVARQVVRRPAAHAAAAVLVALTVATTVLVTTYVGTWQAQRTASAATATGADVRVLLGDGRPVADADDPADREAVAAPGLVAAADGVGAAAPARTGPATAGGVAVDLVALPAGAPDHVTLLPRGTTAADLDLAAPADVPGLRGLALPAGAEVVGVDLAVTGARPDGPPTADVWLAAGPGTLTRVPLTAARTVDASARWSAPLPAVDGAEPWRVVAVEVQVPPVAAYEVRLTAVVAGTAGAAGTAPDALTAVPADGTTWTGRLLGPDPADVDVATAGGAVVSEVRADTLADGRGAPLRLLPAAAAPVPAVLTRELAAALALTPGSTTALRFAGRDVPVEVAAVVPRVPGGGTSAALVDLDHLDAALLRGAADVPRVAEVWARAADRTAAAAGVAAALDGRERTAVVTTADAGPAPLSRPSLLVFWLTAATTLVLAVGGAAAATRALGRERGGEVGVLRALGAGADAQARWRAAEVAGSAGVAVVVGLAGGTAVAALGAGTLVQATSADPATVVPPTADPVGLVVLLGLTALAVAGVVLDVAVRVRRSARDAPVRQEAQQ